ncbi:MAG: ABC transporter permease [Lentisphaerae bacterium]|nr:ABC transporter permease [Lentisphaerota bacterium]
MARRRQRQEWWISLPSVLWLLAFFLTPTLIVLAITFKPADPYGNIGAGWTLDTIRSLGNPNYPSIVWRTIWISVVATVICLVTAVPFGYYMARAPEKRKALLVMLVMVPFWTSFLIRIFAWKVLLHPEGYIHRFLRLFGIVNEGDLLLYNPEAVLLVLVYTYLPFAILPVYAAAEKFDFHLFEAALDLGCNRFSAFSRVFLPSIRRALVTAALVVFIPALGSYVIPDIVGGNASEMIGNKIAQRTFIDRNLPHAAGLAGILTLSTVIPMLIVLGVQRRQARVTVPRRKRGAT